MSPLLREALVKLCWWAVAGTFLGWLLDHPGWGLASAFFIYFLVHLRQVNALYRWLHENPDEDPPEARGIWGDIFDSIRQLQRDERKARENLLNIIDRARASVSALEEAVVLIDGEGNLEWWNPAATTLLGLQPASDFGQPVTNLIRDPRFISYFHGAEHSDGLQLHSPRDSTRWLQFEITRFGHNDRLMLVYDITRLHNLEQMRKDFVANVSHELRTPLTVLSGYLETLLDGVDDLQPRWRRALQQMQAQAGRMNNLVSDLLLLARLENKTLVREYRTVNVPALLAELRKDALAYGHDKQQTITLEVDPELQLRGFEPDLRSAFSNLITNAVKYTPASGTIHVRWWADAHGAYLSVADNGIGIDPKHIPRLTERFYRADPSRSAATGGTGLGLAIVKHVLLQHEATLKIDAVLGKGSTFTCVFPDRSLVV